VLPGPPSELRHAWKGVVQAPQLATLRARVPHRHERLIRLWGISESRGSQVLAQLGHVDSDDRRVTICARDGELEISVRGADVASVDALIDGLASEFGDAAFALDESRGIVELVGDGLRARGWSLGLAESCTGGLLGQLVTSVAGASNWFAGSLVTYSNAAKVRVARVDPATLDAHGAVSEAVALELARGAREVLGTDVGIGITGVAGPGGGSDDKPVGTVHVAIVTPDGELHRRLHVPGNRETVRRRSCTIVLQELRGQLRRS
jgi:nicotinamide-nucleotide amidase